jgi:hypothetical protein
MHGCKAQLHHPTCHMRRRMHAWARMSYEEEDAAWAQGSTPSPYLSGSTQP